MSTIANLHTLFNRPWYIEQNYGEAHIPLLFNILSGNITEKSEEDDNKMISYMGYGGESAESSDEKRVAILQIKNPITKYSQWCGPQGTKSMMRELDHFKNDSSIAGVVLDIDSGGGQAYGTPEFYDYIQNYPKPVVSYTDGLMCSAAYYIGSAADYIIANKRAEAIGSIGAYTQFLDLKGYYEKLGAKLHTIYATKSVKKNKAVREALEGDYKSYIKEELDPLVETFHTDMKNARTGLDEEVFKGGTWSGSDAVEKGLVDELGTLSLSIDKVFELSNNNNNKSEEMNTEETKSFDHLQGALNLEELKLSTNKIFGGKKGAFLTEEQLETINSKLGEIAAATEAKTTAKQENDTLTTAIETAAEKAGVELKENKHDDAITAIADLAVKWNESDGAKPTQTHAKKDPVISTEDQAFLDKEIDLS